MRAYPSYLLLSGLGSFAGACAFSLNLVFQVRTVGLGPLQLVTVGTALEVVCLLAQLPTGVLADLYGRRLSVIAGFLLLGGGALVEGLVPTYAGVLVGTAVWGVGSTGVDGAEQAWLAGELGEDRVGPAARAGCSSPPCCWPACPNGTSCRRPGGRRVPDCGTSCPARSG